MQAVKYLRALNIDPDSLDIVPNEIYENIVGALYNKLDINSNDLRSLLSLNCTNKLLNEKFLFISIWSSSTKYIKYNPNLNLHKIMCEIMLIQTKNNNSSEKVIKLLDSGVTLTNRVVEMINVYSRTSEQKQQSLSWNVLKAQVSLWDISFNSITNSTHFLASMSQGFNNGTSLNCKSEYNLTYIEVLAKQSLIYTQALLLYKSIYQKSISVKSQDEHAEVIKPHIKTRKFETVILRGQINKCKNLMLNKIAPIVFKKNSIIFNNSIEILAGQELLLETLESDNSRQLSKLIEFGVNFTKNNLQNAQLNCKIILKAQRIKNLKLFNARTGEEITQALQMGAQVNTVNSHNETPLHIAIETEHFEVVEMLIIEGADVNAIDEDRKTPLYMAIEIGNIKIVEALITGGGDVNTTDNTRWSPLHLATYCGQLEIVKLLIIEGADVNATDSTKWTPLQYAEQAKYFEIANMLTAAGANVETNSIINAPNQILKDYLTTQLETQQSSAHF